MTNTDRRFAVLIDADNVAARYIKIILDEISNEGEVTYKRIYGDWTKPALAPWKQVLLEHSVTPIQQYSYTTGKSATDSAMIIDAMDILYSGKHKGGKRIINHRLVINGKKLLACNHSQRIKACARTACENNTFHKNLRR